MKTKYIINLGDKFERLTVIDGPILLKHHTYFKCRCDCGSEKLIRGTHLGEKSILSCGCYSKERATTHAGSKTLIYHVHHAMQQRCNNPNIEGYHRYGGRGIKICDEWEKFIDFRNWAISAGYRKGLTLDRKNPDGNYEPSNCEWVSGPENSRRVISWRDNRIKELENKLRQYESKFGIL